MSINIWIFFEELEVVGRGMFSTVPKNSLKLEKWFLSKSEYAAEFQPDLSVSIKVEKHFEVLNWLKFNVYYCVNIKSSSHHLKVNNKPTSFWNTTCSAQKVENFYSFFYQSIHKP